MGSRAQSFTNNGRTFDTSRSNWKNGCHECVTKRCVTQATVVGAVKNMTFNPFYGSQLPGCCAKTQPQKGEKLKFDPDRVVERWDRSTRLKNPSTGHN